MVLQAHMTNFSQQLIVLTFVQIFIYMILSLKTLLLVETSNCNIHNASEIISVLIAKRKYSVTSFYMGVVYV